jgi:hypothetical protein
MHLHCKFLFPDEFNGTTSNISSPRLQVGGATLDVKQSRNLPNYECAIKQKRATKDSHTLKRS